VYFLDLTGNHLNSFEGFQKLDNLKTLVLTSNKITQLNGMETLPALEQLHLEGNLIASLTELVKLHQLKHLTALYFKRLSGDLPNPVCKYSNYR
jgi:Leucine-rich repeat (LRR) protein